MRLPPRIAFLLAATCAAGCVEHLDDETTSVGRLTRDCVVPVPADLAALGAPTSVEYPQASLWIWPALETAGGQLALNAYARVDEAAAVCASGPALVRDPDGHPAPLVALSAAELAANAARVDGKQRFLAATGGFVHGGRAHVFYEIREGAGLIDFVTLGTGMCVAESPGAPCARLTVGGEPILWPAGARDLDQGGLVAGDHAYVYGCHRIAWLSRICTVSGAPLDRLGDPAAYRVVEPVAGWTDDLLEAGVVAEELGTITASPYLGGYLLTTLDPFDGRVFMRRAVAATGPFERRIALFTIAPTDAAFPDGGREHAGLRRRPRELHVTYGVERAGRRELHLASFELFAGDTGEPYQPRLEVTP